MSWKIRYPLFAIVWIGGAAGIHSEGGCKWWEAITMAGIVVVMALIRTSAQQQGDDRGR